MNQCNDAHIFVVHNTKAFCKNCGIGFEEYHNIKQAEALKKNRDNPDYNDHRWSGTS